MVNLEHFLWYGSGFIQFPIQIEIKYALKRLWVAVEEVVLVGVVVVEFQIVRS